MGSSFSTTRWSQVLAAGSADEAAASAALAWLCERQWEPLRRAARRWGVPADQAEDVVQDFCCRLIERRADLGGLDPTGGRFRAWLVTVFRNFVSNRHAQQTALKRGGHMRQESGDAALATPAADPDFDRDWAEVVLANARARLASEKDGRQDRLTSFLSCNAEPGDYAQIGADLGLSEGAVKVAVHRLRQRFAELIRIEIAETLAEPTPQAIDDELAALLAVRRASV